MQTPKFLLADNSEFPEKLFIIHTEFPKFLIDVDSEEIEWYDDVEESETADNQIEDLVDQAFEFFNTEMESYEDDEE